MEGMKLVQLCGNLRDTTSQNNPTSLINHTGCTLFSSSTFAAIGMGSGLDPRGEMSKGEGKGGDCVGQRL